MNQNDPLDEFIKDSRHELNSTQKVNKITPNDFLKELKKNTMLDYLFVTSLLFWIGLILPSTAIDYILSFFKLNVDFIIILYRISILYVLIFIIHKIFKKKKNG